MVSPGSTAGEVSRVSAPRSDASVPAAARPRATMRVLHLSENLPLPFDRRVWMELNALKNAGYVVSAICPMGEQWTQPYEVIDDIAIWRYPPPPQASGFLSYAWEFLYCWLQTARLSVTALA